MLNPKAVLKAQNWLIRLDINPQDTVRQLQRLLGIWATQVINGQLENQVLFNLNQIVEKIAPFDYQTYSGDPILAVEVHKFLQEQEIIHPCLFDLSLEYAKVLQDFDPLPNELNLLYNLLQHSGFKVKLQKQKSSLYTWPTIGELVNMNRQQILKFSRNLSNATTYGRHPIDCGSLTTILPNLAVSYARDWDIEVVSVLLRTCAYLNLNQDISCKWSLEWLLDQQQEDGSFGLLKPEARRAGLNDEDWQLYFLPTVAVLLTLADWQQPGFILAPTISSNVLIDESKIEQLLNNSSNKKSS
ncbi:hypothetical protein [Bacillus cereus]|uniref:hypothetical protein n=1 Tax=Bacillus cereus TaxID=1396 RepID=UPI000BF5BB64|nr:hypothetical protein [Bacillus cereus]PFO89835.1 hypothetical protein COJ97_28890 [Bacillus cereus]